MLKQILALLGFLCLVFIVFMQSIEHGLSYFVLSMLLVFPLCYFYLQGRYFLVAVGMLLNLLVFASFFIKNPKIEMLLSGAVQTALFFIVAGYRQMWERRLHFETTTNERLLHEWEVLKRKHQVRVENLHNLEKQASSLLDLFEIARDFSECLSLGAMVELLHKKVRPELPFELMRLRTRERSAQEGDQNICFSITDDGVKSEPVAIEGLEERLLRNSEETRQGSHEDNAWVFPLSTGRQMDASLFVRGADSEDLAKYEVLAAQLVLQIKKIRLYETVRERSIVDGLTQVFVRRHFMELLEAEMKRSVKNRLSLALLMLDIDHFKRYNDEFGHLVGDATLKEVASLIRQNLRKVDIVARYGGEEFLMAIPETTPEGALEVAERIRSGIARHLFRVYDVSTRVTASIGVSLFPGDLDQSRAVVFSPELRTDLIRLADMAVYRAKEEGRNRVVRYQDL